GGGGVGGSGGVTAISGYGGQADSGGLRRSNHDNARRSPRSPSGSRGRADVIRGAAAERHFLELAVGKEPDPFAVGRKDRPGGSLGARQRGSLELVEAAEEELSAALAAGGVDQAGSRPGKAEGPPHVGAQAVSRLP